MAEAPRGADLHPSEPGAISEPSVSMSSSCGDKDNASLLDGVLRQVQRQPSAEAILDADGQWTYRDLFHASAAIARSLMEIDGPGSPTCLVVADRSRFSVAAAFGALLAGWRFCFVDRDYPAAKLAPIVKAVRPGAILNCACAEPPAAAALIGETPIIPPRELIGSGLEPTQPVTDDQIEVWSASLKRGADIAFFTFTSGTTGTPKILAMSHGAYADVVDRLVEDYAFTESDRVAVQSGFMFDAMWDVFTALEPGGVAVILPDVLYEDGMSWARFLRRNRVTSLMTVPAALQYALETLPRGQPMPPLRQLILTADRISQHILRLIARHVPRDVALHNCYGVAEAPYLLTGRVDPDRPETASLFALPDWDRVDYRLEPLHQREAQGDRAEKPAKGERVSDDGTVTPIASKPAYCLQVRGRGVFAGYLSANEGGVAEIFAPLSDEGYYDTGDIFRLVHDAAVPGGQALRLVGRLDRRLCWLGHRIEPEEIEAAAEAIPGVHHATATVSSDGRLVCTVFGDVHDNDFADFRPIPLIDSGMIEVDIRRIDRAKRKVR